MVLDSGLIKELDGCSHWFLSLRSVVSSLEKPLVAGWCGIHLKFSFPYYSCYNAKANFVIDSFEIVNVFLMFLLLISFQAAFEAEMVPC